MLGVDFISREERTFFELLRELWPVPLLRPEPLFW